MTTTLLFIRHTEHEAGPDVLIGRTPGVALTAAGREHAAAVATRLARLPIRAIYASPVNRARETAEIAGGRLGLEVQSEDGLNEVDFGAWTGTLFADLDRVPAWREWNSVRSACRPPGGETMLEVQARMLDVVRRLRERHPDDCVALFSHGDPIRAAAAYWLGVPLDLFLRIRVDLGSITAVALDDRGPDVLCVNQVGAAGLGWERALAR